MPYYSFKIKKGKFELAVISEDKSFVISQFDRVYPGTVEKPKKVKKSEPAKSKAEKTLTGPQEEEVKEEISSKLPTNAPEPPVKEPAEEPEDAKAEDPEVVSKRLSQEAEIPEEPIKPAKKEEFKEESSLELPTTVPDPPTEEPEEEKPLTEGPEASAVEEPGPSEEDDEPIIAKTAPGVETKKEDDSDFSDRQEPELIEEPEFTREEEEEEEEAIKKETEDSFASIIEDKLKEEAEEKPEEEPEKDAPIKETISYYEQTPEKEEKDEAGPKTEEEDIAQTLRETFEEKPAKNNKVYDILQEKLSSLPEEEKDRLNLNREISESEKDPAVFKFKDLEDLIYLKKPQTKLDYLILTSYFLQEKEKKEKYSLKQINAKVIPQLKEAIDHSVIHESIAHGYFEVVPDYDGDSDLTEYKITEDGIDYLLNEL